MVKAALKLRKIGFFFRCFPLIAVFAFSATLIHFLYTVTNIVDEQFGRFEAAEDFGVLTYNSHRNIL
jgi:hypothetical protein